MKKGPFTFDDRGKRRGPFSEVDICHLVQDGVIQSDQLITTTSGEETTAGEVLVERTAPQEVPPPLTLPSKKPSWNPRTIGWLGLIFSPFWSGIMAVVNARRLRMEQPAWRPIVINLVAVAIGVGLDLVGLRVHLVTVGLFVGATWLIWRLDLRPQVDAYRSQTAIHPSGGGWSVPLIVGSPLALMVFVLFVVAPLFPEIPAYVTANEAGLVFYNEGEYTKSLTFFDRAIQLNPDYVPALYNRGQANYSLGQFDAALVDFNNAIRLAPDEMVAYLNRGLALTEMEQYDKAIHDFNKIMKNFPITTQRCMGVASRILKRAMLTVLSQTLTRRSCWTRCPLLPGFAEGSLTRRRATATRLWPILRSRSTSIRKTRSPTTRAAWCTLTRTNTPMPSPISVKPFVWPRISNRHGRINTPLNRPSHRVLLLGRSCRTSEKTRTGRGNPRVISRLRAIDQ